MGNSNTARHSDGRDVYVFPHRDRFAQAAARARTRLEGRRAVRPSLRRVVSSVRSRRRAASGALDEADAAWLAAVGGADRAARLAKLEAAVLAAAGLRAEELSDAERDRLRAEAGQALAESHEGSEALRLVLARMARGAK